MNKTPSSTYSVRFSDCDLFGHLNNARYIDYFLNAREDHLKEAYDLDLTHFYKKGTGWVVGGHEISYLKPATYNEKITIQTALIQAAVDQLLVEMIMMNEDESHIKSVMWTRFYHVNLKTGQKENHGNEFMEFAQSVEHKNIGTKENYRLRVKEIIENKAMNK